MTATNRHTKTQFLELSPLTFFPSSILSQKYVPTSTKMGVKLSLIRPAKTSNEPNSSKKATIPTQDASLDPEAARMVRSILIFEQLALKQIEISIMSSKIGHYRARDLERRVLASQQQEFKNATSLSQIHFRRHVSDAIFCKELIKHWKATLACNERKKAHIQDLAKKAERKITRGKTEMREQVLEAFREVVQPYLSRE